MNTTLPGVEKRLQDRYQQLVREHCGHAQPLAAGPRILPDQCSTHAAAMAAWRFYLNPRTTFTRLAQPLLDAAADSATRHCQDFALVPIDWSVLDYRDHPSKTDRTQTGTSKTLGYKLLSALLVSDRDGQPLAPLCEQLQTAEGLLSSRFDRPRLLRSVLDELTPLLNFVQGLPLGKRPVFLIDAEADSVDHYRQWHRRGWLFLVRADAERYARLAGQGGEELRLPAIAERLQQQGAFAQVRVVDYQGRKVLQHVAEAAVVLDRPGYQNRVIDGQRQQRRMVGKALPLRLIITELRDEQGQVLERWYLLTNVPAAVAAATIALWYYWRWRIETFWKLLKGAGQQVEHWQQENGRFILKRLLVASMACVLAWRLGHSQAPQAAAARRLVMGLSGRQVAYGKEYTQEGLLAGIWVLLAMAAVLEEMPASRLKEMAYFVLGGSAEPAAAMPLPLREAG
jgi:IS4 transposase